jgi:hypothetical protein
MNSLFAYPLLTRTGLARLLFCDVGSAVAALLNLIVDRAAKQAVADIDKGDNTSCKADPGASARGICQATARSKDAVAMAEIEYNPS